MEHVGMVLTGDSVGRCSGPILQWRNIHKSLPPTRGPGRWGGRPAASVASAAVAATDG